MKKQKSNNTLAILLTLCILPFYATAALDSNSIVSDFDNADIGIAFTMLSKDSWENPGKQIFHSNPSTPQSRVQAVTLSNASKKVMPYQGDTHYGLIFSMTENSGFYKYFATMSQFTTVCDSGSAKMVSPITQSPAKQYNKIANWALSCSSQDPDVQIAFCGRCADGGPCAGADTKPNTPSGLWPALGDQVPFKEFQKAKNAIVAATGSTNSCTWAHADHIWNEFDTNGLSPTALAGVMIDHTHTPPPGSYKPKDATLCAYLINADPTRSKWSVYTLTFPESGNTASKLTLTRPLDCSDYK